MVGRQKSWVVLCGTFVWPNANLRFHEAYRLARIQGAKLHSILTRCTYTDLLGFSRISVADVYFDGTGILLGKPTFDG